MARETKIGLIVYTAMLPGNDVLDVERDQRQFVLMTSAVLAAVSSTITYETTKSRVDRHAVNPQRRR